MSKNQPDWKHYIVPLRKMEYHITENTDRYSEKKGWKGLKSFGMVCKIVKKQDGTQEEENRYYICSIGENAEEFERANRKQFKAHLYT